MDERILYKLGEPVDHKTARHIMRYDTSLRFLKEAKLSPSKILDFGCGSGYGTKLIKMSFDKKDVNVVGFDISKDAIKYCEENNAIDGAVFLTEYEKVEKNGPYDVVFLIEIIEHISDSEGRETIKKLIKNSPNAIFLISTPLNNYDGQSPTNEHHINCFIKTRFEDYLKEFFKEYELYLVDWNFNRKMSKKEFFGNVVAICKT